MLVILSGPSGAGKSTVVSQVMKGRTDICFSTSVTTRKPRPGEVHGKDYFFIDQRRFNHMIQNNELLEYAQYVSHSYGTPSAFVYDQIAMGKTVILDIEVQGAYQVYKKVPEAARVFIMPPSLEELRNRLIRRGTDSEDVIEARIQRAKEEIRQADFYQYLIINDNVNQAAFELSSILAAEQCRFNRDTVMSLINGK